MPYIIIILLFTLQPDTGLSQSNYPGLDEIKMLIVNGERSEATELLEHKIRQGDPSEEELQLLVDLYHQSFSFSKLIDLYQNHEYALDQNPAVLFAYGQAVNQMGFENRAVQILENLRTLNSNDPRGLILLGRIYFNNENWEAAEPVYDQLVKMVPENLFFRTQLAKVNGNLRETEYSREILRGVLREDPFYLAAILELAISHIAANEVNKARELIEPALRQYPDQAQLWNLSARTAYNLQKFSLAIEHWGKVIDLGKADNNTYRGSALSYYQLGNAEQALENFDRSLAMNPGDMVSLYYKAMVYRQIEDWKKAEATLNQLFEIHITDYFINTMMQRAVVAEELDKIEEAINDYRLVKLLDPSHENADFYLAALYDRHFDDPEKIIGHYQNFLNLENPDPSLIDYARGRISVLRERVHFARGRE
jgi:tetratricopeptide (TPR) repeat protein